MPTDQDWGRLYQYDTTGDAGLVMPPRSYYVRQFQSTWQNLSIAMLYRNCGLGGDYSDVPNERISEIQVPNLPHFGLTQATGGTLDMTNIQYFLGLRGVMGGVTQIENPGELRLADLKHTVVNAGSTSVAGIAAAALPLAEGMSDAPFNLAGMRFVKNDLDGKIYMKYAYETDIELIDDGDDVVSLQNFMEGISGNLEDMDTSFQVDYSKLNSFFLFWPYYNSRLILQAVGAIKFG